MQFILWPALFIGLYATTFYSYLLFHTLVELFSIVVAGMIFFIFYPLRKKIESGFYVLIGTAYLFTGSIDLLHTLAYKGMNIFAGYGSNLPTQLWIAARYLESLSLLVGLAFFFNRGVSFRTLFLVYSIFSVSIVASIFFGAFPDCFREGTGLTGFKKGSEYIICMILFCAIYLAWKRKDFFEKYLFRLISGALITTVIAEMAFTFYINVYGISNMIGHFFKLISYWFIYQAFVKSTITVPFDTIFKQLAEREKRLVAEKSALKKALAEIKTLRGLLPICASCKKIRSDEGFWIQVENYLSEHADVRFTHSICPECTKKLYPDL